MRYYIVSVLLLLYGFAACGEPTSPQTTFPDMGLAQYLQTYGGWAVAAICMIALTRLYTKTSNLLEKRNDQFIAVLERTTAALQATTQTQQECVRLLREVEEVLNRVQARLGGGN